MLASNKDLLFVMTRFDNGISVIDTDCREEIDHVTMHSREPASLRAGRRFLYDAALTSSHGDSACSSCHVFGDKDDLSWDLGDPDGDLVDPPDIFRAQFGVGQTSDHPMKGPMATQSLRGIGGDERGYDFNVALGKYQSSVAAAPNLTDSALRTLLINDHKPATYTCVPPGSGHRLGVDRDSDGYRDGDEIAACSDRRTRTTRPERPRAGGGDPLRDCRVRLRRRRRPNMAFG